MRIHIEGDIYLSSNGTDGRLGYTLDRKKIVDVKDKKTKEITGTETKYDILGYYTTIESVLYHGFLKLKIATSTAETLDDLLQEVKGIRETIKTILGGI